MLEEDTHWFELLPEVLRHRGALRLVRRQLLEPFPGQPTVEYHRPMRGLPNLLELVEHPNEPVHGIRGSSALGGQRCDGMERAVGHAMTVYQQQSFVSIRSHSSKVFITRSPGVSCTGPLCANGRYNLVSGLDFPILYTG